MLTAYMPHSAQPMADSLIRRYGLLTESWRYDYGVVWRGMEALYALTGDARYFDFIKDSMDALVDDRGEIRGYQLSAYNLDYVCNGRELLYLYKHTGQEKYCQAAKTLREQLRHQPRTSDGGFWHKKCYPYQMWLDGLHMAAPFYAAYSLMTNDDEGIRDAARQLMLAYEHTYDPQTGLNRHGWDESRAERWADQETGRSAHAWGRAVGWYMLALADVLELLPREHACFEPLRVLFERLAGRMLEVRVDGVWMQVLDCPDRPGNYPEASGSCLMTCAMLKMARLGYIPEAVGLAAQESFRAIQRHFVGQMQDGTTFLAKTCFGAGLGGPPDRYRDGSYDYYISEAVGSYDLKGTGAYIQAACEMERTDRVAR